jgi:nicotinamidase-related amidase
VYHNYSCTLNNPYSPTIHQSKNDNILNISTYPTNAKMGDTTPLKATLGPSTHPWTYETSKGFDLSPSAPKVVTLQTSTTPITISPKQSALVIIDMQNFFLSPGFGRPSVSAGRSASDQLLKYAIPAARKAGIRIIWLNWGLTENELEEMPAGVSRAFGFSATTADGREIPVNKFGDPKVQGGNLLLENGANGAAYSGLGSSCGEIEYTDEKGEKTKIDAGRLLMRDTWNAALYAPLEAEYEKGRKLTKNPDVWINKNRMSGLWGGSGECEDFLQAQGIKTLLLAGVNTDQCVGGTFTDAFSKGYDCVLLGDGAGTTSPKGVQEAWEWNAANCFGFCMSCAQLAEGVEGMGA